MNIKDIIKEEGDSFHGIHKSILYYGIRHDHLGMWCGYIVIKPNHPFYKTTEKQSGYFHVHGGVTFVKYVNESYQKILIDKNIDNILIKDYVIGFDCGHSGDLVPSMVELYDGITRNDVYRDKKYVIEECKNMINQLDKKYPKFFGEYKEMFKKLNS